MEGITGRPFNPELTLKAQLPPTMSPQLAARYGVRWFGLDARVSDPSTALPGWDGPVVSDGPLRLYENPQFKSEALVYRSVNVDDGRPLYEQQASSPGSESSVIVEHVASRACVERCTPVAVPLRRSSPEHIAIDVADREPGMLVVAEGWDPGWRATVDGKPRAIRAAMRNFLAIETRPGDRRVVLTYHTPGLQIGALVTGATVVLLAAALVLGVRRDRRRASGRMR
jgi:hypothetical protein